MTHLTGKSVKSDPVAWHGALRRVDDLFSPIIVDCAHDHRLRIYAAYLHRLQIAHQHHHPVTHLKSVLSVSLSRLNCGKGKMSVALVWWKGPVVEGN